MTPSEADESRPPSSQARWLNATVLSIGLASLCSDVGHEMATVLLPALLASLGGASVALGIIEGLADGLSSFAKLFSGLYSDRLSRRKPLAVFGYFATAAGMASFSLATMWWQVLFGRVFGWLGRGVRGPVRNVLLSEATTPETRGRAFGFERAMDSAGAVVGPLLALGLVALVGVRATLALTLVPGLAAALLIGLLVKEGQHTRAAKGHFFHGLGELPREFWKFLGGVGLAGLGDFSNALLILWATEAFQPEYGLEQAAMIATLYYTGYNIVYMITCYVAGMLADTLPKKWVLAGGYSLAVIPALALIAPLPPFVKFALVFGFSGLYMGVYETVENATASLLLPAAWRGTGFGMLATVNGMGDFFSSAIVGLLWVISPEAAMGFVIVVSLLGAAVIASTHPPAT